MNETVLNRAREAVCELLDVANLKKGDILTPEFIEGLTAEQQKICNQINRRTEFKVTKTTYNLY